VKVVILSNLGGLLTPKPLLTLNHLNIIVPIVLISAFYIIHTFFIRKQNRSREKKNQHDILESQIEMQEQTFQKISSEIHDNISLTLSLSKIYLHDLDYTDHADLSDKIHLSTCLIKKAIDDLNTLSKSLNPDSFEKFGLIRSIEELVKDIHKAELFKIKFNVKGIPHSQGADYELILFRMIQESLNNVIRHANATEVSITLDYEKTSLSVRIRDNGTGFKTENTTFNNNGSGLGNMKKRAQMINAQLFIDSQPQNGTLIKILIPHSNN